MCEDCDQKQINIDVLEEENEQLKDEVKTLETELARIDKWQASYPR